VTLSTGEFTLKVMSMTGDPMMVLHPGPDNTIEDLTVALKRAFHLGNEMVAFSFDNRLLDPSETVESAGIHNDAVLVAIYKSAASTPPTIVRALSISVVQMSGEHLATLTPGPKNTVGDLIDALMQNAGLQTQVPLLLSFGKQLLEDNSQTVEDLGITDGSVLTAIRFPELFLVAAYDDCAVRLWSAESGRCERIYNSSRGAVLAMDLTSDGMLMITGCMDGSANLWSVFSGALEQTILGHKGPVCAVACAPNGTTMATGSFDRRAQIWDLVTGEKLRQFAGHKGTVASVAFSPDGTHLATGSEDGTAKIWRIDIKDPLGEVTLHGHRGMVTSVQFSPDNTTVATGSIDMTAAIWKVEDGACTHSLRGHRGGVSSVAYSRDASLLATASLDSTAMVWCIAEGCCLCTFRGHSLGMKLRSVAFSPAGTQIATGGDDGAICLWNVRTGECKARLTPDCSVRDRPCVQQVAFLAGPLRH